MSLKNKLLPLYNSRIIDTYIKLIKSKYSFVNIGELLSYAKMKPYEVADQGHWFTQEQINLFYERLVKITNNENIAREAGRYAASPDAIGVMRQYVLGLVSPATVYELIGKTTINFTRSSTYESRKLASNKIEITVTPNEGVTERAFQCENRTGFFEAIVNIYNNKFPRVEHSECMFSGGKVCRYIISWEKAPSAHWNKIRDLSLLFLCMLDAISLAFFPWITLKTIIPVSAVIFLLLMLITENNCKKEMKASLDNTRDSIDELIEQININYNNALMTNEIGQALSTCTNHEDILSNVICVMEKRLDYDRGLILMANQEKPILELKAGYGYSDDQLCYFNKVSFHLNRPESKGIFVASFREQRPYLVNDLNDIEEDLSPRSLAFAKKMGSQSFICCPIVSEEKSIGILAVDNIITKRPLVQSDISRLMGIASVIGISIRNTELCDSRMRQFNSIIQVLAASIDARDSLTAGHSEKVTEYALGICKELGLSKDYCEMIRVASLLHDYGKIGVPDAILKKQGRLTPQEYEIVKTHSDKTKEILAQINFEGIYCEVPDIAGAHHEKIDGSGYPRGIKGNDIPLGAKIIAVADYFEAVTAKRHYRGPMLIEDAFSLLREESGTHFEKKFVEALFSYYTKMHPYGARQPDNSSEVIERRKHRVSCRIPVVIQLNGKTTLATSRDISGGGLYVATQEDVSEGNSLDLSIALPDKSLKMIEAKGRVVWVNRMNAPKKPTFPIGFGVELLELKKTTEDALNTFLSSYIPTNCHQFKEKDELYG